MNGVKLNTVCCDNTIPASELQNCQVAVIVSNVYLGCFNGRIVTRHKHGGADHLLQIGHAALFSSDAKTLTGDECRVRVLKAGESIVMG